MNDKSSKQARPARHRVKNPGGADLEFDGELLVDLHEHDIGFVQIYQTAGGRYILRQNWSQRPGVNLIDRTVVVTDREDIANLLGHSAGAKRALSRIGHETSRWIE